MRRGTTPTHTFTLPIDAASITKLRITYVQDGEIVLTKTEKNAQMDGSTVKVKLTQAETLSFNNERMVEIQLKVLTTGGDALVSDVWNVHPLRVLDEEELT